MHATCDHAADYCAATQDNTFGGAAVTPEFFEAAKAHAAKMQAAAAAFDFPWRAS